MRFRPSHFIFLLFIGVFAYTGRLEFKMSPKEQSEKLAKVGQKAIFGEFEAEGRVLRYTQVGQDSSKPLVIFLHGSPGSCTDFMSQLSDSVLLSAVQMITVDRPGFGATSEHGIGEASLEKQAAMMRPLMERFAKRPIILVGHSWGGPLIARMAMDYGDKIAGLIFVGASLDPNLEPSAWYRPIMAFPLIRWMIPRTLVASNTELRWAVRELNAMLPLWEKVRTPWSMVQGVDDSLVPVGNADFAKKQLKNAPLQEWLVIEKMDHFVPWTHPQYLRQAILSHVDKLRS